MSGLWDFIKTTVPLLFSMAAIAFILYLFYIFSKYMANKVKNVSGNVNMKVLERVALNQDKGIVIMEICSKYYLIGFSTNNVEILKEIDKADFVSPQSILKNTFLDNLNCAMKSRLDVMVGDKFKRYISGTSDKCNAKKVQNKKKQTKK